MYPVIHYKQNIFCVNYHGVNCMIVSSQPNGKAFHDHVKNQTIEILNKYKALLAMTLSWFKYIFYKLFPWPLIFNFSEI